MLIKIDDIDFLPLMLRHAGYHVARHRTAAGSSNFSLSCTWWSQLPMEHTDEIILTDQAFAM